MFVIWFLRVRAQRVTGVRATVDQRYKQVLSDLPDNDSPTLSRGSIPPPGRSSLRNGSSRRGIR
jgi:hypothetical protein